MAAILPQLPTAGSCQEEEVGGRGASEGRGVEEAGAGEVPERLLFGERG